jgi:uroporphyrinogen-III synthase
MHVIVTRVQPQASQWAELLALQGYTACAWPLIVTRALVHTAGVAQAWQCLADYAAVMFVSGHAVNYFFEQKPALALYHIESGTINFRAWGTGPGTRAALLAQGVPAVRVDAPSVESAQFDSENLWQQVHAQVGPGTRVLIVRGDTPADPRTSGPVGVGRDWLAQRLQAAGAQVDYVVAYQRGAPVWDHAQTALATLAARDGSVWLFSSAEALGNLAALLPGQTWAGARAVATHARIAEAARGLGFGLVAQASPSLQSVLASIESLP